MSMSLAYALGIIVYLIRRKNIRKIYVTLVIFSKKRYYFCAKFNFSKKNFISFSNKHLANFNL